MMGVPPDPHRAGSYGNPQGYNRGGRFRGAPNLPGLDPDRNYMEGDFPGIGPKLSERISGSGSRQPRGRRERANDR